MTNDTKRAPKSLVLHSMAGYYDLLAGMLTLGRERELRERLAALASLTPGESVLDVGCGTGSLAIAAKRRVGPTGSVCGIDASPEMIEKAQHKAATQKLDIAFQIARAEELPYPDASFDAVLSTLMLHHLPRVTRERLAEEMHRVLRPGGRVLAVDFEKPANKRGGLISRFHRHGHVPLREIIDLLDGAELHVVEMGSVGVSDLQFALATKPQASNGVDDATPAAERFLAPLPPPRWLLPLAILGLVLVHLVLMRGVLAALVLGTLASVAVVGFVLVHITLAGGVSAILRRHRKR